MAVIEMKNKIGPQGAEKMVMLDDIQAAAVLGCKPQTLRNWRSAGGGRGPAYHKVGRCVRYALSDLYEYLATCRIG